jgi:hypothetical protein
MTAEERAARLEKLVAPLHIEEWGQKEKKDVDRGDEENNDSYGKNAGEAKAELPSLARPSRLTENKYDGASSDDSSDEDMDMPEDERMQRSEGGLAARANGIAVDEDDPSVVERDGDEEEQAEMDMQEEMDEFLKFATETLGLTEEQYGKILGERKERGGESYRSVHTSPSQDKDLIEVWAQLSCLDRQSPRRRTLCRQSPLKLLPSKQRNEPRHRSPSYLNRRCAILI